MNGKLVEKYWIEKRLHDQWMNINAKPSKEESQTRKHKIIKTLIQSFIFCVFTSRLSWSVVLFNLFIMIWNAVYFMIFDIKHFKRFYYNQVSYSVNWKTNIFAIHYWFGWRRLILTFDAMKLDVCVWVPSISNAYTYPITNRNYQTIIQKYLWKKKWNIEHTNR